MAFGEQTMRIGSGTWGVLLLCACLCLTGCTTNLGDFTLLSSKNVNLANFSNAKAEATGEKTHGEDCVHIICVFPTGTPNLKQAVDQALEAKNAYMLTNARIKFTDFYIPYIYGQIKYEVDGTPVRRN
jgi:hypothetical protein